MSEDRVNARETRPEPGRAGNPREDEGNARRTRKIGGRRVRRRDRNRDRAAMAWPSVARGLKSGPDGENGPSPTEIMSAIGGVANESVGFFFGPRRDPHCPAAFRREPDRSSRTPKGPGPGPRIG